jgi:hypothetical protein
MIKQMKTLLELSLNNQILKSSRAWSLEVIRFVPLLEFSSRTCEKWKQGIAGNIIKQTT